jgi:hypothetical protein
VHCPKCGADLPDTASECGRCGIVFAKYAQHEDAIAGVYRGASESAAAFDAVPEPGSASAWIVGAEPASAAAAWGRAVLLLLLGAWTLSLVSACVSAERLNSSVLHLPNLVFHEAGHILWIPFGRFLTVLGGSLTQVLVPLVCAGAFLWQTRDPFAASVAVWWAGENLLDVAPYINDARDLKLILLGGKTGAEVEGHDWEYLLNAMGVAYKDHTIAAAVQAIGALVMIAALVWGGLVVANQLARLRGATPGR